jgi:hypothetical protein
VWPKRTFQRGGDKDYFKKKVTQGCEKLGKVVIMEAI